MPTLIPLSSQMAHTVQRHLMIFALFLLLLTAATPPVSAQAATPEDRIVALHATIPSLTEKFNEDNQRWSMSSGSGSMVYFYAGTLRVRASATDSSATEAGAAKLLASESTLPADVMLAEVDVNFIEGGQNHGYGFYIAQGPQDYALFFISSNGLISVQRVTPESSTFVVPWRKSAAIKTENHELNHLSLLLENGHAVFFVNGTRVTDIKGARFHNAKLGLAAAMYAKGSVEVAFQDLRYWNLTPIEALSPEELKTRLTAAELTLADLPESYEAIPEDDLKIELDRPLSPGDDAFPFIVKSAFGYGNFYRMNIVIGTSGPINGSTVGLFDPKNVTNNQDPKMAVLDLARTGDESIAFTFTYVEKGETTRFDAELFRRGQVLAYMMVMYPEGTEPSVTLAEMVKIWDARLLAALQGTNLDTPFAPQEAPTPGTLTLDDLPEGYTGLSQVEIDDDITPLFPHEELDEVFGNYEDRFVFVQEDTMTIIEGYRYRITSGEADQYFDHIVADPQGFLDSLTVTMLGTDLTGDLALLDLPRIGEKSAAFTFFFQAGETAGTGEPTDDPTDNTRMDLVFFRRNDMLALLLVSKSGDGEATVSLKDLAKLWDQRIIANWGTDDNFELPGQQASLEAVPGL